MFGEMITIDINGEKYTSIGRYVDNHDGISAYAPPHDNTQDWILFLESSKPIIILWLLGYYKNLAEGQLASLFEKKILSAGGNKLESLLLGYYPDQELTDIFEDFNFGKYAPHNQETNELPELKYNGVVILNEDFDLGDHVFIKSDSYNKFISELNEVINEILKELC